MQLLLQGGDITTPLFLTSLALITGRQVKDTTFWYYIWWVSDTCLKSTRTEVNKLLSCLVYACPSSECWVRNCAMVGPQLE